MFDMRPNRNTWRALITAAVAAGGGSVAQGGRSHAPVNEALILSTPNHGMQRSSLVDFAITQIYDMNKFEHSPIQIYSHRNAKTIFKLFAIFICCYSVFIGFCGCVSGFRRVSLAAQQIDLIWHESIFQVARSSSVWIFVLLRYPL